MLESDQYGMRNNTLYHIFSPRTKGVLRVDKLINQVVIPINLRDNIILDLAYRPVCKKVLAKFLT